MKKQRCQKCRVMKSLSSFQLISKAPKPAMTDVYSTFCDPCVEIIKRENPPKTHGWM